MTADRTVRSGICGDRRDDPLGGQHAVCILDKRAHHIGPHWGPDDDGNFHEWKKA